MASLEDIQQKAGSKDVKERLSAIGNCIAKKLLMCFEVSELCIRRFKRNLLTQSLVFFCKRTTDIMHFHCVAILARVR